MTIKRFCILISVLAWQSYAAEVNETIELGQKQHLNSKYLKETRSISIYLPPSFKADPKKRYPVFYCLDGETHYKATVGTLDWLSKSAAAIPEHMVVAIHNAPGMRHQDLVPQGEKQERFQAFQKFLVEELVPYIDKNYPTQPFRILSGHSLGGLFGLKVLEKFPNQFQAFLISSPYFAANRGQSIDHLKSVLPDLALKKTFVFASLGAEVQLQPFYEKWIEVMETKAPSELSWQAKIFDDESHMTTPIPTIHAGLKSLYADIHPEPSSALMQKDVAHIQNHFKALSKHKYGFEISAEHALTQKAIFKAKSGNLAGGLQVLQETAAIYPHSWKIQLTLSRLLEAMGKVSEALEAATKAQGLASHQEAVVMQMLSNRVISLKNKVKE